MGRGRHDGDDWTDDGERVLSKLTELENIFFSSNPIAILCKIATGFQSLISQPIDVGSNGPDGLSIRH